MQGRCDRSVCAAGYFDLDGDRSNGCEVSCDGLICTLPGSGTVALSAPPLPETGQVAAALAGSAPVDLTVSPVLPVAVMGEATPLPYAADPAGSPPGPSTRNNLVENQVGYPAFVH